MSRPTRRRADRADLRRRTRGSCRSAGRWTSTTSSSGRSRGSRPIRRCLDRWRGRCAHLLVDEVQDVDRAQLRLALLLAAPANRILLVGDDDQSIYGWRLADVRRVLGLDALLDGLRRIDLEVNYRCPAPVVERAVRLVARNRERFAKRIRAGPAADGRLVLAPDGDDDAVRLERVMRTWPDDGSTQAVLARTNRELIPAVVVAMALGRPFRAPRLALPLEDPALDGLLAEAEGIVRAGRPLLVALGAVRDRRCAPTGSGDLALATAMLGVGRRAIASSTPSATPCWTAGGASPTCAATTPR